MKPDLDNDESYVKRLKRKSKKDYDGDYDNSNVHEEMEEESEDRPDIQAFNLEWKNPPKLDDLIQDYTSAQSYHSSVINRIIDWRTILLAPDRDFGTNRSKITPKIVKRQAEWTYPVIEEPMLSSKNMFTSDPVTAEDPELARLNSLVLNHQMNKEINKVEFVTNSTRRFVDDGTCIVKIGWDKKTTYKMVREPDFKWVPVQDPEQAMTLQQQGLPPFERKQVGWKKVNKLTTIKNAPILEVMDPAMVIIDPNAQGDIDKAQFIIEPFDTNFSDLKKAGIYKNLEKLKRNLDSNSNTNDENRGLELNYKESNDFNFKDNARKVIRAIRYWGYWDIDGDGMTSPIVATWVGDTLIHIERNPTPYLGLPFDFCHFRPVHKSNYGEPDAEMIKDNQEIIGALTRGYIDILGRSAAGQTGRAKNILDSVNKIKYENGEDFEYNPGMPDGLPEPIGYPEISNSVLTMIQMQENHVETLTGKKAFAGSGISGSAYGDSATAVRSALDASSKREMGILRRFTSMMERIAYKIVAMNQVFLEDDQILKITNSDFLINNRDLTVGKYDMKIKIQTPEQKQAKVDRIAFLLQTTANTLPFDFTQMIMDDMYELEDMPDLAEKIRGYQKPKDPMEEMQIQLLQAQIAQIQSVAQENQMDVQLKGAKTQETMAKTELLKSDKDNKDLDYMHKYDGTSRQQDQDDKMQLEHHKTARELKKEEMKQQIVQAQLLAQNIQNHRDRVHDADKTKYQASKKVQ